MDSYTVEVHYQYNCYVQIKITDYSYDLPSVPVISSSRGSSSSLSERQVHTKAINPQLAQSLLNANSLFPSFSPFPSFSSSTTEKENVNSWLKWTWRKWKWMNEWQKNVIFGNFPAGTIVAPLNGILRPLSPLCVHLFLIHVMPFLSSAWSRYRIRHIPSKNC